MFGVNLSDITGAHTPGVGRLLNVYFSFERMGITEQKEKRCIYH